MLGWHSNYGKVVMQVQGAYENQKRKMVGFELATLCMLSINTTTMPHIDLKM